MGQALPNITGAEWSVLERLWDKGPATVRQLTDVLYPKGGPSEYATVHRLLERLEAKGYVGRARAEGVLMFQAAAGREAVVGKQLEVLLERTCGGSLQALLTNLVRVKRLNADELRELLALVENMETQSRPKKPRS